MHVLVLLTVVTQDADVPSQVLILRRNGASFPARPQILARVKTKGGCSTHRARLQPPLLFPGEIFGSMSLASILYYCQVVLFSELKNRVHVGGLAVEMHRNDSADWPA